MKLSVVIHTKNAADHLVTALKTVAFADEVVIIDMQSDDETVEIARRYTDKVFFHADEGYADPARNFGLQQVTHPWVLVLDADEEVTPGLQEFILKLIKGEAERSADAYYLARQNIIFGQWITQTGWWPDYQLRLFKKGSVSWQRGVHRPPDVKGTTQHLAAEPHLALIHHNYSSVSEYLERLNRYTSLTAEEKQAQASSSVSTLNAREVLRTFNHEFFRRFFAEKGHEDGVHGLSLSLLQATYELATKLKQWEMSGFPPDHHHPVLSRALQEWRADLAYWVADYHTKHTRGLSRRWWQLRRKFKF